MLDFHKLKSQDIVLVLLVSLISIIGLATLFSTTFYQSLDASQYFKQQLVFFLGGILAYLAVSALDSTFLSQPKVQAALVILTSIMLIALLVFGQRISGTRRWFIIAGVGIQPSEFAKLVVVMSTAATFASLRHIIVQAPVDVYKRLRQRQFKELLANEYVRRFAFNAAGVLAIVLLVRAQPSLGNALLIFGLWVLMLLTLVKNPFNLYAYGIIFLLGLNILFNFIDLSGVYDKIGFSFRAGRVDLLVTAVSVIFILILTRWLRLRLEIIGILLIIALITSVSIDFAWNHALTGYQQDRIVSFLNPAADPLGAQWQVDQAKIAIGSGQIFGKGFLNGTQSNLGLLPFAYTDFAYAAYTEQFGLVGSVILLGLYYLLIMRIFQIAVNAEDNFGRLVCMGVALMFSLNVIVNIGMNLGIMPVTGVPLPFVSYGGSAILVNFLGLGLVQMVNSEFGQKPHRAEKLLAPDPTASA